MQCLYLSLSNTSSIIVLARLILRSILAGKCADAPAEDLALSAGENQSVLVGFSPAFARPSQQHAANTGVLALRCKPLDRGVASAHSMQAVMSYCQEIGRASCRERV